MHNKIHLTKNFSRTMLNVSLTLSLLVVTLGVEVVTSEIQSSMSPAVAAVQSSSQGGHIVASWNKLAQIQANLA